MQHTDSLSFGNMAVLAEVTDAFAKAAACYGSGSGTLTQMGITWALGMPDWTKQVANFSQVTILQINSYMKMTLTLLKWNGTQN